MNKNNEIGYLIHKIDTKIKANMDQELSRHDLTFSQSQVIHLLRLNSGQLSQKALQDLMKVSHPTVVGLVQRLESNGYVKTEIDENDKRYKIVTLCDIADEFKKDMMRSKERFDKKMFQDLPQEKLDELYQILQKMYENIEKGGQ